MKAVCVLERMNGGWLHVENMAGGRTKKDKEGQRRTEKAEKAEKKSIYLMSLPHQAT